MPDGQKLPRTNQYKALDQYETPTATLQADISDTFSEFKSPKPPVSWDL